MTVCKWGHSCLYVTEGESALLIDPGAWTLLPEHLPPVDAIFVSHLHQDHYHPEHLRTLLTAYPEATLYLNEETAGQESARDLPHTLIADGDELSVGGELSVVVAEAPHIPIYGDIPRPVNSTLLVNDALYFPADAARAPTRPVRALAAVISAPFWSVAECAAFIEEVQAPLVIGVHDALIARDKLGPFTGVAERATATYGGQFAFPELGEHMTIDT
jgi:L-ascorbate metabolism protein UlaG (beta-lactamase superfamily)